MEVAMIDPSQQLTLEKLQKAMSENPTLKDMDVPAYYASSISGSWSSNDLTITFGRGMPAMLEGGELSGTIVQAIKAQAIIAMSPQTAMDLYILLGDGLDVHQKQYGPVETDFTRARKQPRG
jgi:hypothetical protein